MGPEWVSIIALVALFVIGTLLPINMGALAYVAAWLVGLAAYQWLSPTGPAWWVEQVERLEPPAWGIGATLPSFAVSFTFALALAVTTRRIRPDTVRA